MRLGPQQVEQLKQRLQTTFKNPCNVCGSGNWQFDDVIFELRQFMGGGATAEGVIKPAIAVTCGDCGNIVLINAFAAGALRVEKKATGTQPAGSEAQPSSAKASAIQSADDNAKSAAASTSPKKKK